VIINVLRSLPPLDLEPGPDFTSNVLRHVAKREAGRARRNQYAFAAAFIACLTLLGVEAWGVRVRDRQLAAMRTTQARLVGDQARLAAELRRAEGLAGAMVSSRTAAASAKVAVAKQRQLESRFDRAVIAMRQYAAEMALDGAAERAEMAARDDLAARQAELDRLAAARRAAAPDPHLVDPERRSVLASYKPNSKPSSEPNSRPGRATKQDNY